jgi:hypothetical protein
MSGPTFTREDLVSYSKQAPTTDTTTAAATVATDTATAATKADNASDDATNSDIDLSPDSSPDENTASTDSSEDGTSGDNADSPPADADSPDSDTHTEPNSGRSRARERIEDLIAERNALKAYGKHLESRMAEMGTAPKPAATTETQLATVADKDDEPPTLAAHNYDPDAYAKANAAWLKKQVGKEVAATLAAERVQATNQQIVERFKAQEVEFRKTTPDYDVVTSNKGLPQLTPAASRAVLTAENAVPIAYHLAKNPELATRISRMAPEQQLVAVGRLEAQLTATKAAPSAIVKPQVKKTVSKAPPPPSTVSTGGNGQKDQASMGMDEWVAVERQKKVAQREMKRNIRSGNASR